jgi:hypothetical protein
MQPENLEPRVTALEGQVRDLRGEVQANHVYIAAVRELTAAVDRDVSEMRGFRRATIATMNALREDMVDMRRDITGMRHQMSGMRQEMRSKFAITAAGQERIVELIQQVIDAQGGPAPA